PALDSADRFFAHESLTFRPRPIPLRKSSDSLQVQRQTDKRQPHSDAASQPRRELPAKNGHAQFVSSDGSKPLAYRLLSERLCDAIPCPWPDRSLPCRRDRVPSKNHLHVARPRNHRRPKQTVWLGRAIPLNSEADKPRSRLLHSTVRRIPSRLRRM